jgi:hypothetical protein
MRWMTFAVVLLLLAQPGKAFAGPPEKISGMLIFDEVADGLGKYRKEKYPKNRIGWLEKLAPTRDPRVAIALAEAMMGEGREAAEASRLLAQFFVRGSQFRSGNIVWTSDWWEANESDVRRRAKLLP